MIKLIHLFVVFPAFGELPTNVADQLGFGERQGADSQRGCRMALCHAVATRQSSGRLLN